jgi:maltoporin
MAKTLNLQTFDPSSDFRFREMFVQGGNLFSGRLSSAKFWAGNRYYARQDIHVNDFWYTDLSGYGGGVEDIGLGKARASLAYIGSTHPSTAKVLLSRHKKRLRQILSGSGGKTRAQQATMNSALDWLRHACSTGWWSQRRRDPLPSAKPCLRPHS